MYATPAWHCYKTQDFSIDNVAIFYFTRSNLFSTSVEYIYIYTFMYNDYKLHAVQSPDVITFTEMCAHDHTVLFCPLKFVENNIFTYIIIIVTRARARSNEVWHNIK